MKSEIFLYGYGIVCVGMLIYNLLYSVIMQSSDDRLEARIRLLRRKLAVQIDKTGYIDGEIDEEHILFLKKKLSNINFLIAFDYAVRELPEKYQRQAVMEYCRQIQPVLLYLARVYKDKEDMQAAYFAYVLPHVKKAGYMQDTLPALESTLIEYMTKKSLYCKVNALQALCDMGTEESVFRALQIMDMGNGAIHDKVITDILMMYEGDYNKLIRIFLMHFEEVSPRLHLSMINYIRFRSGEYCEMMYELMMDEKRDKELRLSAVRYFGKYYYGSALGPLIAFAKDRNPERWEYAAAAAAVLARYDGEDVVEALKSAVHSPNWYVRYNAAESLQAHHLDSADLISVVGGSDRFAREMVMYRLNVQRMEEERNEAI